MALIIDIPEKRTYRIEHLVLDFNGTLAVDGQLKASVKPLLLKLSEKIDIHILTADTFGTVAETMQGLPVTITVLGKTKQVQAKAEYVARIGAEKVVAIGNGSNDQLMLQKAALGISVMLEEGVATKTMLSSDLVCHAIDDALMLLLRPMRLVAGLR